MKAYYRPKSEHNTLVLSFEDFCFLIRDFAPWIAKNPEDYDYSKAKWMCIKIPFTPLDGDIDVTNNKLFIDSVQLN